MKAKIAPRKEIVLLYRYEQIPNGERLLELLNQMKLEYRMIAECQCLFCNIDIFNFCKNFC